MTSPIGGITFNLKKDQIDSYNQGSKREWVMTNGLGGYAGGTPLNGAKRKHHGHLIASLHPPVERYLVLAGLNEWIDLKGQTLPLHTTKYPHRISQGYQQQGAFYYDTYPVFHYEVDQCQVEKTLLLEEGKNSVLIKYRLSSGNSPMTLRLNPAFNFRPHGHASTENDHQYELILEGQKLSLLPRSKDLIIAYTISQGNFTPSQDIYDKSVYYDFEFETGMEGIDTHYTPYTHTIELDAHKSKDLFVHCEIYSLDASPAYDPAKLSLENYFNQALELHTTRANELLQMAKADSPLKKRLTLSANQFVAYRSSTKLKTILAGLPWFSDWGRDTMIAMGGIALSTGRYQTAKDILKSFSLYEKKGLLPNVFPDEGLEPMYNTVDASLWYFQALYQYYQHTKDLDFVRELMPTLRNILTAYIEGTEYNIHMTKDGLIHAGSGLDQVTWMDVRINNVCVTPRHGKPVEINALWYNALMIMDEFAKTTGGSIDIGDYSYLTLALKTKEAFNQKFWNAKDQCLYDVVDELDPAIRPNQIYAVDLPYSMLSKDRAKMVVDKVHEKLYTPYGLRSLSQEHPDYKGIYIGPIEQRDYAYHQGTAWGFLLGAFITAYVKVYPDLAPQTIMDQFIQPAVSHLHDGCLGGFGEIFDGDEPHKQRGCYSQAWSIGELLRALEVLEE